MEIILVSEALYSILNQDNPVVVYVVSLKNVDSEYIKVIQLNNTYKHSAHCKQLVTLCKKNFFDRNKIIILIYIVNTLTLVRRTLET